MIIYYSLLIEEKYIDSENIGMYKRPISRVYTFEDVKVRGENTGEDEEVFETLEEAQEELKKRAKALFEEDKVDLIKAYYNKYKTSLGIEDKDVLDTTVFSNLVESFEFDEYGM